VGRFRKRCASAGCGLTARRTAFARGPGLVKGCWSRARPATESRSSQRPNRYRESAASTPSDRVSGGKGVFHPIHGQPWSRRSRRRVGGVCSLHDRMTESFVSISIQGSVPRKTGRGRLRIVNWGRTSRGAGAGTNREMGARAVEPTRSIFGGDVSQAEARSQMSSSYVGPSGTRSICRHRSQTPSSSSTA